MRKVDLTTQIHKEQRRFRMLLTLIGGICGLVFGAGATRMGACHTRATPLVLDAARVVHLEAEAVGLKATLYGCNQALFAEISAKPPGDCGADPLGGPCAISWSRIWRDRHDKVVVGCGPRNWWIVTWWGFNPMEKP